MESLQLQLRKPRSDNPWGFRIQGGRDFNRPLVISRITCDSVADYQGLRCGDEIIKINNHVAASLTHYQAQELIVQSGCELNVEIVRVLPTHLYEQPFTISFPIQKPPMQKTNFHSVPRVGFATNIQMSHSNYDLTHRTPVCKLCCKEIRGPFIIVLDYCFCPNHFNCYHCQRNLSKETFIEVDGAFYCESDYSKYLAPKCRRCLESIVGNEVTAIDSKWHSECFNCNRCGINLSEKLFKIGDDGVPYCLDDWNDLFQVKCTRCKQAITVMDKFVEMDDNAYHSKCFSCSACRISLDGKAFHNRNGKPFCKIHAYAGTMY